MCPQALIEKDKKQNTYIKDINDGNISDLQGEIEKIDGQKLPQFKKALNSYLEYIDTIKNREKKGIEENQYISTLKGVLEIYKYLEKNGRLISLQLENLDKTLENMLLIKGHSYTQGEYAMGYMNLGDVYLNNCEHIANILANLAKKNIDPQTIEDFMQELQKRLYTINLDVIKRAPGDNEAEKITDHIETGLKNLENDTAKDQTLFDQARGLLIDTPQATQGNIVVIPPVLKFYGLGQRPGGISMVNIFPSPDYFILNTIGTLNPPNLQYYTSLFVNPSSWLSPTAQFLSTYERYYEIMGGGVVILSKPHLSPFRLGTSKELFNYIALIEKNLPLPKKEEEEKEVNIVGGGGDSSINLIGDYRKGSNEIIAGGLAYTEKRLQLAMLILNTAIEQININELFGHGTITENMKKFQVGGINNIEPMLQEINQEADISSDMTVEKLNAPLPENFGKITIGSEDQIVILPYAMYEEQNANNGKITDAGLYVVRGNDVYHIAFQQEKINELNKKLKNIFPEVIQTLGNNVTIGGGAQYQKSLDQQKKEEKIAGYFIAALPIYGQNSKFTVGAADDGDNKQALLGLTDESKFLFIGGGRFVLKQETASETIKNPQAFLWTIFGNKDYAFGGHIEADPNLKEVQGAAGKFQGKILGATVDTFLYVRNKSGNFDLLVETPDGVGFFFDVKTTEDGKTSGNIILNEIPINKDMSITLIGNFPPFFSMYDNAYFRSRVLDLEDVFQKLAEENNKENRRELLNEIVSGIYYLTSEKNFFGGFSSYPLGSIIINHKKYGRLTIGYSPTIEKLKNKPSALVSYTHPNGSTLTLAGEKGNNWAISAGANIGSLKISGSGHGNIRVESGIRVDRLLDFIPGTLGVGGFYWYKRDLLEKTDWDNLIKIRLNSSGIKSDQITEVKVGQRGLGFNAYYGNKEKLAVAYTNIGETRIIYTENNNKIEDVSNLQTLSLAFGYNPNKNSNITTGLNIFNINEYYGGGLDFGAQYNFKNLDIIGDLRFNYARDRLSFIFKLGVHGYIPAP